MRLVPKIVIALGIAIFGYQLVPKRPALLEVEWMQDENGWKATEFATSSGEYCICPPYECASMFEATLIVNDRAFIGSNTRYVLVSSNGPVSADETPKRITEISSKKKCFEKNKGEEVVFELNKLRDSYTLSVY